MGRILLVGGEAYSVRTGSAWLAGDTAYSAGSMVFKDSPSK